MPRPYDPPRVQTTDAAVQVWAEVAGDATQAPFTVLLPTGAADGDQVRVMKTDLTRNAITIAFQAGSKPGTVAVVNAPAQYTEVVWVGTQWLVLHTGLSAALPWTPSTFIKAGQLCTSPAGDVVSALADFTTGGSFDPTKWSPSGSGTYRPLSYGEGSSLWVYGDSYVMSPGARCTAGQEQYNRIKSRLGMAGVTTYGVSSTRMAESAMFMIANGSAAGFATVPAGAKWDGTRRGLVLLQSVTNDMFNAASAGGAISALSAGQVNNFRHALRTALAVLSSSARYEEPGSGTNWSVNSSAILSGGAALFTSTPNAFVDVSVTVPASGVMYVLSWFTGTRGDFSFSIGGTTYGTFAGSVEPYAVEYSGAAGASGTLLVPFVMRLTGLPTGAQTIRVTKTDAGAGLCFLDAFFAPAVTPPPIVVCKAPVYTNAGATVAANKVLLDPVIDAVCAEFPNAIVVNPAYNIATDLGSDGIHPNDRGMRRAADAITTALVTANLDPNNLYTTV